MLWALRVLYIVRVLVAVLALPLYYGCVCVSVLILKPAELKLPASTALPTATEKGPKACHELEFFEGREERLLFRGDEARKGARGPHTHTHTATQPRTVTARPPVPPPCESRFADESMATAAAAAAAAAAVGRLTFSMQTVAAWKGVTAGLQGAAMEGCGGPGFCVCVCFWWPCGRGI